MNFFKKIAHTGISWSDSYTDKRGTLLTNNICLILSGCIIAIFTTRELIYRHIPEGVTLTYLMLGLFAFLFPVFLNRIMLKSIAKMVLCYLPPMFLWFIFIMQMRLSHDIATISTYDSLRIFLLVVSVVPYLIFNRNNWKMMVLGVLPVLISLLFFERILSFWEVGYAEMGIEEYGYELMQMRTLAAYVILSGACFAFQSIIYSNDIYNKKSSIALKEKSDEIETQNEELVSIHSQLSEMNNHLENKVRLRTDELKKSNDQLMMKNVQLTQYAFLNSHKLRAPVASILGLIGLMENENATSEDRQILIEKIKQSTANLDDIIQEINGILEGKDNQD